MQSVDVGFPRVLQYRQGNSVEVRVEFSRNPESYLSVMPTRVFIKASGSKASAISIDKVKAITFDAASRTLRITVEGGERGTSLGPMTRSVWDQFGTLCDEHFQGKLPLSSEGD